MDSVNKAGPRAEFKWAGPNFWRSHHHWPVSSVCSMLHWPVHKKFGSIMSFRKTTACDSTAYPFTWLLPSIYYILSLARILLRKCQRRKRSVHPAYFLFPCGAPIDYILWPVWTLQVLFDYAHIYLNLYVLSWIRGLSGWTPIHLNLCVRID
jgi:hypothetical protein